MVVAIISVSTDCKGVTFENRNERYYSQNSKDGDSKQNNA